MNVSSDVENLVKNFVDLILDHAESKNVAWNWGEETLRVDSVIELINDLANMNYKRPYPNNNCALCKKYYYRFKKSEHREHCCGDKDNCKDFDDIRSYR